MTDDLLDYVRLARQALLAVPRHALALAARDGLPGDHHFYLAGVPGRD